jgi:hypothetical protein
MSRATSFVAQKASMVKNVRHVDLRAEPTGWLGGERRVRLRACRLKKEEQNPSTHIQISLIKAVTTAGRANAWITSSPKASCA